MADQERPAEEVLTDSKAIAELLAHLQDELKRAADKNDSLLEAIESSEARVSGDVPGEVGGVARKHLGRGGCSPKRETTKLTIN